MEENWHRGAPDESSLLAFRCRSHTNRTSTATTGGRQSHAPCNVPPSVAAARLLATQDSASLTGSPRAVGQRFERHTLAGLSVSALYWRFRS